MANVVEVALKINVDDLGEPLHQPVHHPIQCLMRRAFGSVCKRARMKVSLKDRLQDQLYGSLNNPILNSGYSDLRVLPFPLGISTAGSCSARRFLKEAPGESRRETSLRLGSRWIENSLHRYPASRRWLLLLDTPLSRSLAL
jgi:hypothetical protein